MLRGSYSNRILILIALILVNSIFISAERAAEDDSIEEIEEKIFHISEEEREILELLFDQMQEIERLEREKEKILVEIDEKKDEIEGLEERIERETKNYEDKLDILKEVLRSYQRMGPISYIQIILDAENITSLLRRVNTLRDLTKNTGELLDSIHKLRDELIGQKMNLDEKLSLLEERERDLIKTIEEAEIRVGELEAHLASLQEDREYYEERLNTIMEMLDDVAILIQDATKEFTHIIREGDFKEEELDLTITSQGIKALIHEDTFNRIIQSNENLPPMTIHFHPQFIEMEFPEENLSLRGSFIILDEQTLQIQIEEGSFYGFILREGTIDKFFEEGHFILDIRPIIGKNAVKSIELKEGYVELRVEIHLF
ncbi:MAG: hypothetical protein GXY96_01090 [Tissierellia bacterium]|nr:hypothetical protein [Tissierellia bacterium]